MVYYLFLFYLFLKKINVFFLFLFVCKFFNLFPPPRTLMHISLVRFLRNIGRKKTQAANIAKCFNSFKCRGEYVIVILFFIFPCIWNIPQNEGVKRVLKENYEHSSFPVTFSHTCTHIHTPLQHSLAARFGVDRLTSLDLSCLLGVVIPYPLKTKGWNK